MKRRGFLGLLAALPAAPLFKFTKAEALPATELRYGIDVGRPGGDETCVSAWQSEDGKFTCRHVWYAPPDADMRFWMRTHDGRFLPIEALA